MVLLSRLLVPLVGLHGVEKKTQRRRRTSSNIFPRRAHPVPSRTPRFLRPIDYPRYLPSRLSTDSSERVGSLSLSLPPFFSRRENRRSRTLYASTTGRNITEEDHQSS